jgi:predicted nucleotidyltransferase
MKDLQQILEKLRESKTYLQSKYGVVELAVFGSYAREEQELESDIDILVTIEGPIGLRFVDLALELEDILQQKVDPVSSKGIKPRYMAEIIEDLQYA